MDGGTPVCQHWCSIFLNKKVLVMICYLSKILITAFIVAVVAGVSKRDTFL